MNFNLIKATLAFFVLFFCMSATAQYSNAVDLYNKGIYVEAQRLFQEERAKISAIDKAKMSAIDFYSAMCALKLQQNNAEVLAKQFIDKYPESKLRNDLMFSLACYYYDAKRMYRDAGLNFEKVKKSELKPAEQGEFCFKYGFCLYKAEKLDDAIYYFAEAKNNIYTRFATQAEYYYSHILYEQGKYAAALEGFENLKHDSNFADLAPYYILQIYFYQKEYDKVIKEGEAFYPKAKKTRQGEVLHVIAESYFRKGDYKNASEYFEKYEKVAKGKISLADHYLMSYTDFEQKNYDKAIQRLEHATTENDTLSQKIMYLLGGAYANIGKKEKAMIYFENAAKMNFDDDIKKDSQFNYAKLALETKGDLQPISVFLQKNKEKLNDPDVRNVIVRTYIAEKYFEEALNVLNETANLTQSDCENLQKANYYLALQNIKNKNYNKAVQLLNNSLQYARYNEKTASLAKYWKAESQYNSGNIDEAEKGMLDFLKTADKTTGEYQMAQYTLGYIYSDLKNESKSNEWFEKYILATGGNKSVYLTDAYNRMGDNWFKQRKYGEAGKFYGKAYNLKMPNSDYSLYQNAITTGLAGNNAEKRQMLNAFVKQYPASNLTPASYFELGRMDVQLEKYGDAEGSFKTIINKYQGSTFYRQSLIELGLINVNKGDEGAALKYYKQVVDEYPNSPEAKTALDGIKDIYVDMGNVNEYFNYADQKKIDENNADRDSLTFSASERLYLMGNLDNAISSLEKYISLYPEGKNVLQAKYYLGDCHYRKQQFEEAANDYQYVISQPKNEFTLDALNKFAVSKYKTRDFAASAKAFEQYASQADNEKLVNEAKIYSLNAYEEIKDYKSIVRMAEKIENEPKIDTQTKEKSTLAKARALQEMDRDQEAFEAYKTLSQNPKTPAGAEAVYNVIDYLYQTGKVAEAEDKIFKFSDSKTTQSSWLARSFIVLANIYADKKDYFQARATISSIIKNYKRTDDGIIEDAENFLETIKDK